MRHWVRLFVQGARAKLKRFPLFASFEASSVGKCVCVLAILILVATARILAQELPGPGQPVFVSTFNTGEILKIDSNLGTTTVIYSDTSTTNGNPNFLPEGLAIGPDGKLYVCVPLNDKILRMNQDGTQVETVYSGAMPTGPEGPRFNGNDLFFNIEA